MKALAVYIATLLVGVALVLWALGSGPAPISQPIAYNHNVHVEDEGLACIDCHTLAETMASAAIPDLEICEDCHDTEPLSDSVEETKLIQYLESGDEIPWNRLYEVPDHVFFSHRRHVTLGELECDACHGRVSEQLFPPARPVVELSMDWCMDCHRDNGVTNDCLACHR